MNHEPSQMRMKWENFLGILWKCAPHSNFIALEAIKFISIKKMQEKVPTQNYFQAVTLIIYDETSFIKSSSSSVPNFATNCCFGM